MEEERNSLLERFASFSIREYALKKRGSWEEGCRWPLGHETMPCPRYRWWASELETARSDPPAEGAFSGGRVKKAPKKKRSIVELFAVAPQVCATGDESEDEAEVDIDNMGELEKKKNKKKSKKEKLHDAVALSKSDVGNCGKVTKDCSDKKTSVQTKVSSKQRKVRAIQSSNLVFKKKIRKSVVLPARGILKISNKTSPNKLKNSDKYHPSSAPNHVHSKQTKRHVSFSDQNDIIGQKKVSSVKLSDVLVVSAAAEKSGMVNGIKNNGMTAPADDIRQASPEIREFSREDQTSPTALTMTPTEPLTKHKSVTTADHLVDLNHSPYGGTSSPFLEQGGPIPFASDVGAGCSSILGNITKDSNGSIMGYLLDERAQMRSCPSRMISSKDYPSMMNSSRSTCTPGWVSSELCMPRMSTDDCQLNQSVNHIKDGFSIVSQVEPSQHQLMGRVCSSMPGIQLCPNGLEIKNPTLALQGRCNNGNFIGLPLNSQGEFIQWHDKDNQLSENPNRFIVSERNCMQNSIEYWNNIDRLTNKGKFSDTFVHLKEKPGQLPDPRILHVNIGRYQEPVTTHDHQLSYLDQGSSGIYSNPCRKTNGIDSQHAVRFIQFEGDLQDGFQPINRPTVRLMGKDVAIGENSGNLQRFTGKEWVDKEFTVHRRHDEAVPNWFSQSNLIDDRSCGFVKRDILCSMDSGRTYPSIYDISVDHRQQYDRINGGPQWTARNAISIVKDHASNLVSFSDHPTSMLVRNAPTIEPSKLMDTSVRYDSCMQIPPSHTQYDRDRILFPDERRYRRKNVDRDGEYQERVNLADDISQTMQPWSNNVRSQRNFQDASPYPSLHSKYRLFGMPESDVYRFADPSHSMEFANNSTAYGFSPIIATVDAPLSSPFMKLQSNTAMNYDQQQIWRADIGIRPGFSYLRDLNQATRPKRRFPSEVDEFMRAPKKPNSVLLSQPGPQDAIRDGLYIHRLAQHSSPPIDFHGYGNKVVGIHDTAKDSPPNTSGSDSQKPEDGSWSLPTKLSAGARHILRPGRNVDPGNSIPMHSTVPFVVGSSSGRIHEPQSKSAKIYQF